VFWGKFPRARFRFPARAGRTPAGAARRTLHAIGSSFPMLAPTLALFLQVLATIAPLAPGTPLPALRGQLLSGRPALLPDAAHGRVTLVALGFSRASGHEVEAIGRRFRDAHAGDSLVTCYEVPMMPGYLRPMAGMITGGMRKGTPPPLHDRVMTVWGQAGDWRRRLEVRDGNAAYLVLIDREGRVRWRSASPLDDAKWSELNAAVTANR
jgi:hypothetical protein